jgi:hypothetical protein
VKFILWKIRHQQWRRTVSVFYRKTWQEESATFSPVAAGFGSVGVENFSMSLTQEKYISRFALLLLYWFVGILWENDALLQCRAGLNPALQSGLLVMAGSVLSSSSFPPTP